MALADTAALVATLELKDKFSRTARSAEGALGRLEAKTSTLGKVGQQATAGLQTAGRNIARFGTIAAVGLVGAVTAATKAAIDFEDAFAGIRKTVDEADLAAAGLTFEDLSNSIRSMAREIPIAATELAAIGEAAGALGIRAADIEDFTRVVAQLSVTTNLTSEEASTALGQLGNVLHLTGGDFEDFADSLVALGNAGASTESQIVEMAARFGAAGNSAGLSKEEILALSSAVASMGIEVEAGGSALSRIFNNVATNIGTSSAKATEFAKALGLSAEEFREAWGEDSLGTFQDFLAELNTLDQFEAANLLKKVGITNVRDVAAVRLMGQNVEFLNDQLAISENATGALGEEAAKKFATTASQIQLMKNRLTDVGITIGSAVLPKINELGKRFGDFLNTPAAQNAIKQFADAIPGVIDDLVGIAKGIPWGAIGSAAQFMGSGAKLLLQAFTSMPGWVQTAVLTGWGLNKLTGGAIGGIAGTLAKSAFGALRGQTPANPVFVADVAGGVGGAGGAFGGGRNVLGDVVKIAAGAAAIAVGNQIQQGNIKIVDPGAQFGPVSGSQVNQLAGAGAQVAGGILAGRAIGREIAGLPGEIAGGIVGALAGSTTALVTQVGIFGEQVSGGQQNLEDAVDRQTDKAGNNTAALIELRDDLKGSIDNHGGLIENVLGNIFVDPTLENQVAALDKQIVAQTHALGMVPQEINRQLDAGFDAQHADQRDMVAATVAAKAADAAQHAQAIDRSNAQISRLDAISAKDFSPTLNASINVSTNVSVDNVVRSVTSHRVAIDNRGGLSEL